MKYFTLIAISICMVLPLCAQSESPSQASSTSAQNPSTATDTPPSPVNNEPVPYPQQQAVPTAKPESKPKEPPKKFGDCTGDFWIGQRVVSERHAGWGWVKQDGDGWTSAKWVMLEEKPGKIPAPGRFYTNPNADDDVQYKLYGSFAPYKGYEPNIDAMVSVFVLKGFEIIGKSEPIKRKLPGPTSSQPGRISERDPSRQRSLSEE